jgi:hypothetical protein
MPSRRWKRFVWLRPYRAVGIDDQQSRKYARNGGQRRREKYSQLDERIRQLLVTENYLSIKSSTEAARRLLVDLGQDETAVLAADDRTDALARRVRKLRGKGVGDSRM